LSLGVLCIIHVGARDIDLIIVIDKLLDIREKVELEVAGGKLSKRSTVELFMTF